MSELRAKDGQLIRQSEIWDNFERLAVWYLLDCKKEKKLTYEDLSKRLNALGIKESADRINRKINRRRFSAAFFIACLTAMEIDGIDFFTVQEIREQITGDA